jgi:hypothetical protein
MTSHATPTTLDSIKKSLVALRMPRAPAVVIQIEGASYRLRQHADLVPEHIRSKAITTPPAAPKRRGRPPAKDKSDHNPG